MTTQQMDTVGAGRGGRMSRQRSVTRCCAYCEARTWTRCRVARCDGGDAERLARRRRGRLAIGPADGEERERNRLKARLGEMLLERELLEQKIALLEGSSGSLGRRRSRR